jgi:large conductance mechanosensitive channel
MSIVKEFKEFAIKGNVVDMAIGLVIGVAFKAIVTSLVKDIVMPPVGKMLGGVDFSKLFINLSDTVYLSLAEATKAGAPIIRYGTFIQTIIDFIIISFVIFLTVKFMNKMKKEELETVEEKPAVIPEDILLLREIRDQLSTK